MTAIHRPHDFRNGDRCARCDAPVTSVEDNFIPAECPNPIDVKLIERVARALCKMDGNDPDDFGYMHKETVYTGFANKFKRPVPAEACWRLWHVYAPLAETAILELEAAAMEPFIYRPNAPADGPERAEWSPPEPVRRAWATEVHRWDGISQEAKKILAAPQNVLNTAGATQVGDDVPLISIRHPRSADDGVALTSISNPMPGDEEILLQQAVEEFEEGRTVVTGLPSALSQTGEEYVEIVNGEIRLWDTLDSFPVAATYENAIQEWSDAVQRWAKDKPGSIYWRTRPEITRTAGGGWLVYSRLLISDKPVISTGTQVHILSRLHEADEPGAIFSVEMEPLVIDASGLTPTQTEDGIKLASKDAPLLEALKRQREKDGF